jgi:hypothetical protein
MLNSHQRTLLKLALLSCIVVQLGCRSYFGYVDASDGDTIGLAFVESTSYYAEDDKLLELKRQRFGSIPVAEYLEKYVHRIFPSEYKLVRIPPDRVVFTENVEFPVDPVATAKGFDVDHVYVLLVTPEFFYRRPGPGGPPQPLRGALASADYDPKEVLDTTQTTTEANRDERVYVQYHLHCRVVGASVSNPESLFTNSLHRWTHARRAYPCRRGDGLPHDEQELDSIFLGFTKFQAGHIMERFHGPY